MLKCPGCYDLIHVDLLIPYQETLYIITDYSFSSDVKQRFCLFTVSILHLDSDVGKRKE